MAAESGRQHMCEAFEARRQADINKAAAGRALRAACRLAKACDSAADTAQAASARDAEANARRAFHEVVDARRAAYAAYSAAKKIHKAERREIKAGRRAATTAQEPSFLESNHSATTRIESNQPAATRVESNEPAEPRAPAEARSRGLHYATFAQIGREARLKTKTAAELRVEASILEADAALLEAKAAILDAACSEAKEALRTPEAEYQAALNARRAARAARSTARDKVWQAEATLDEADRARSERRNAAKIAADEQFYEDIADADTAMQQASAAHREACLAAHHSGQAAADVRRKAYAVRSEAKAIKVETEAAFAATMADANLAHSKRLAESRDADLADRQSCAAAKALEIAETARDHASEAESSAEYHVRRAYRMFMQASETYAEARTAAFRPRAETYDARWVARGARRLADEAARLEALAASPETRADALNKLAGALEAYYAPEAARRRDKAIATFEAQEAVAKSFDLKAKAGAIEVYAAQLDAEQPATIEARAGGPRTRTAALEEFAALLDARLAAAAATRRDNAIAEFDAIDAPAQAETAEAIARQLKTFAAELDAASSEPNPPARRTKGN
jgi:hypothetical protein